MLGQRWPNGGSTTTPFGRTAAWATCRRSTMPRSAPRYRNGTGRCAQSGATHPAPLQHRARPAQMANRLYSSLDEKRGSGQYGNTAVLTGTSAQTGAFQGQPIAPKILFTATLVLQNGKWRAVAAHRTAVRGD